MPSKKALLKPPARRGGARPGSGRPPAPKGLDWAAVRRYAETHAPEAEIRTALEITDAQLGPAETERLRNEIAKGHAVYRLKLREEIARRGRKTRSDGTDGSVNALALQARNTLDWDKQVPTQEVPPDLGTARQRLGDLILRLAQHASSVEGRRVSPLEIVHRESQRDERAAAADSPEAGA